jgi:dTDP-4-amino-4,6-dideoxygalactose transaminase
MALGIGPGDEVIVPAFTFFATGGEVARLGATPVFAEIDERTFNIDPADIERLVTGRTRAIIPVHVYGQIADMDAINTIAQRRRLMVIEDAAQAIGATAAGRYAGTFGDLACLSFYPTKNLGGFGEGGMVLTRDGKLAELIKRLRNQGQSTRYLHDHVGGNFRLDALKAAVLTAKLEHVDEFNRRRRDVAAKYDTLLGDTVVATPYVAPGHRPVYHQYSILAERRDELAGHLRERGVDTAVHYPIPLHRQPCFAYLGYAPASLPVSERISSQVLSLPCHPMLGDDEIEYVSRTIAGFYADRSATAVAATATGRHQDAETCEPW